jgi:hypothetical protein
VLAHLSLPVCDAGHGRVCHLDAPHYTSFVFLPADNLCDEGGAPT